MPRFSKIKASELVDRTFNPLRTIQHSIFGGYISLEVNHIFHKTSNWGNKGYKEDAAKAF
jgi:hypothetical protein